MNTVNYVVGHWCAEARIEEVDAGKLMAMISVSDARGDPAGNSRHTAVFDHQAGGDAGKETEAVLQRILHDRYGI